jgi:hypothetical protein
MIMVREGDLNPHALRHRILSSSPGRALPATRVHDSPLSKAFRGWRTGPEAIARGLARRAVVTVAIHSYPLPRRADISQALLQLRTVKIMECHAARSATSD